MQAIAMDEDAELAGLSEQVGAKNGAVPAGAMMASSENQSSRKVPVESAPSDSKAALDRPSQEPPLLPSRSGLPFRTFPSIVHSACLTLSTFFCVQICRSGLTLCIVHTYACLSLAASWLC